VTVFVRDTVPVSDGDLVAPVGCGVDETLPEFVTVALVERLSLEEADDVFEE
jgi:hypothetical protein